MSHRNLSKKPFKHAFFKRETTLLTRAICGSASLGFGFVFFSSPQIYKIAQYFPSQIRNEIRLLRDQYVLRIL